MADANPQGFQSPESDRKHEGVGVSLRGVLIPAACLAAIAIFLHLALWGMLALFDSHREKPPASLSPLARLPQVAPPPRLQALPPRDLAEFQAREDAELNQYGWVDRATGRVQVPIEKAKELFLKDTMQAKQSETLPPASDAAPVSPGGVTP